MMIHLLCWGLRVGSLRLMEGSYQIQPLFLSSKEWSMKEVKNNSEEQRELPNARSTTLMNYQFDCCFANFLFLKGLTGLQKHICYDSTRNIYQVVVVPGRLPLTRMESE